MGPDPSAALEEVKTQKDLETEREIRKKVFVEEQRVPSQIEFDEHENDSVHFLIKKDDITVGCVRYRWSGPDIKIERLAVLKEHRGQGFGKYAVESMIRIALERKPERIHLHSQIAAKEFYEKCGFRAIGPSFMEAGIEHIRMYLERK